MLQFFSVATKAVSLETASASEVNGVRQSLTKKAGKYDGIRNDTLASLNVRYGSCESNPISAISTILNPKFKKDIFIDKNSEAKACDYIDTMLRDVQQDEEQEIVAEQVPSEDEVIEKQSPLWSLFKEVMEANGEEEEPKNVVSELFLYLQEPQINPSKDILEYWKESSFAKLKKLARKYLAIPAATVCSERMFSTSGLIFIFIKLLGSCLFDP
jgi:hypothetical protein